MSQHYSDPARASDPHALPDVEVFESRAAVIHCNRGCEHSIVPAASVEATAPEVYCPRCGYHSAKARYAKAPLGVKAFWWQPCFPGCLPDSDPVGPFATEAEAFADAQRGEE